MLFKSLNFLIVPLLAAIASEAVPLDFNGDTMRAVNKDMSSNQVYFWGFGKTLYFLDVDRDHCQWKSVYGGGSGIRLANDAIIPLFEKDVHSLVVTMNKPCNNGVQYTQGVFWTGSHWSTQDPSGGFYNVGGFYPIRAGEYAYVYGSLKNMSDLKDVTLYCMIQDIETHELKANSFTYHDIENGDYSTAIKSCVGSAMNPIRFCSQKRECLEEINDSLTINSASNSSSPITKVLEAMASVSLENNTIAH